MRIAAIKYFVLVISVLANILVKSQDSVSIVPISINTKGGEYAPVYYKKGIVFSGANRNNETLTYVDSENGEQLSDLYYVPINEEQFGKVSLFSKELKTPFHDGPITFSKDGETAYFTRNIQVKKVLKNNTKIQNMLGVFKSTFDGEKWGTVSPCFFNSSEFNVGQPMLSPDGSMLYVVSDKPGGFGGVDIYYAEIADGFCGSLVNLGKEVNSKDNEVFPFIDDSQNLYFASNREGGNGGLDIYQTKFSEKNWNTPFLMDTTINSSADDFGLVYNEDHREGYFCSNRAGSDDIYKIKLSYPEFGPCAELINEFLCYEFFEEATLNADSVAMIYEWDFGDGSKERSLETYHCYEKSGFYVVQLNILDPLIDKNFINGATYELEIEEVLQPEVIAPDTISINTPFSVSVKQGKWNEFQIANYYIDYGNSIIVKNDKNAHIYDNDGIKEFRILITGYNEETGLIEKQCFYKTIFVGTSEELIVEKEKFYENLEYSSFNTETLSEIDDPFYALEILSSDTEILKDSIQFKQFYNGISEVYDEKSKRYSYIYGKTLNPFELIELFRDAHSSGFDNAIVKAFAHDSIRVEDLELAYDDPSGSVKIILNNIHFEYDGYNLDKKSKIELQKLIDFLNDKETLEIEISAHTDASRNVEKAKKIFKARGQVYTKEAHDKMSSDYNLKLSQKRAESVVEYITTKGVSKVRLKAVGYGEKQVISINETDQGRKKNRRVEFKIIYR
jgi:outer membrane protein OmpA-like peptidoglycan-associated protein